MEARERARLVVGVERYVLDPVVLLARLPIDDGRDVERETVQVHGQRVPISATNVAPKLSM